MRALNALAACSAFAALAACATLPGGENARSALAGADWTVISIDGRDVVSGTPPTLTFGSDGRVTGTTGCNRFFASYTEGTDTVTIGQVGGTRMACAAPLMEQERTMLAALPGTHRFAVAAGQLTLTTQSGAVIRAR
ncbi:META domain-containing protein [Erythrobacteraceae bacterium CFH 75059]|uniref:META domain-containing protein n=1 Tax=Qipengyuania thermophila TaxID=2509361 RepID=UPI00101FBC7E|nr:META domain-containing protein [Qipengyuania thermophila]TCD06683.1 META domain-containing protein [Erythrobacteraceae bacterium CFH 75059]